MITAFLVCSFPFHKGNLKYHNSDFLIISKSYTKALWCLHLIEHCCWGAFAVCIAHSSTPRYSQHLELSTLAFIAGAWLKTRLSGRWSVSGPEVTSQELQAEIKSFVNDDCLESTLYWWGQTVQNSAVYRNNTWRTGQYLNTNILNPSRANIILTLYVPIFAILDIW